MSYTVPPRAAVKSRQAGAFAGVTMQFYLRKQRLQDFYATPMQGR